MATGPRPEVLLGETLELTVEPESEIEEDEEPRSHRLAGWPEWAGTCRVDSSDIRHLWKWALQGLENVVEASPCVETDVRISLSCQKCGVEDHFELSWCGSAGRLQHFACVR